MLVPLKKKYLEYKSFSFGHYRARTGPHCCNKGCGSTKKKMRRMAKMGR